MPLTAKGKKVLRQMRTTYVSEKKAKSFFYAMIHAKKLKGVERRG